MRKTYKRNYHRRFSKKRKSRHAKKGGGKEADMYNSLYPIEKQNSTKSARKTLRKTVRKRPTSAPDRAQNHSFRKKYTRPFPHYSVVNRKKQQIKKQTVDAPVGYSF